MRHFHHRNAIFHHACYTSRDSYTHSVIRVYSTPDVSAAIRNSDFLELLSRADAFKNSTITSDKGMHALRACSSSIRPTDVTRCHLQGRTLRVNPVRCNCIVIQVVLHSCETHTGPTDRHTTTHIQISSRIFMGRPDSVCSFKVNYCIVLMRPDICQRGVDMTRVRPACQAPILTSQQD